ncbi:MAG: hypothetical protein GX325_03230 [Peptococcaceae bacterium]|nr:hypothetical protein [Peptococcaceae bacterium]
MEAERSKQQLQTICIEVPKVYDFCFQAERRENICTPLNVPHEFEAPPEATVRCRIKNACCNEVSRSKPDASGRSNVTFAIVVDYMLKVVDGEGHVIKRFNDLAFSFTKTVLLCAPEGTMTNCEIVNATCGPCLILCNLISCTFDLCIVIQSVAIVKILVPSYGFCTPALCEQVSPEIPFVCPPALFPPQCPPVTKD